MTGMRLQHPIRDLDRQVLLPAGTELSPEVLDGLVSSRPGRSYRPLPLLRHGTVERDVHLFMETEPYHRIFEGAERRSRILGLMREVQLVQPVLESLDYFKTRDPYTYRHVLIVFAPLFPPRWRHRGAARGHDPRGHGRACARLRKDQRPPRAPEEDRPLSRTERGLLEHHAAAGYVLLCYYQGELHSFAAKVAMEHHERRDRSGYPRGIRLADPMVEIIAACDIYDALLSPRPYRPTSYDNRTALEVLTEMALQGKLGWEVVRALVAHNRKLKPHPWECRVSTEKRGVPPDGNLYGVIADESP